MSLSRYINCQGVCVQQSHAAKCLLPWYKVNFADFSPCCCYAMKTNNRTIRSRLSQPACAGKGGNISQQEAHHCITLRLWTWLLCSVCFIPVNKLPLQELNQSLGIKMPPSVFSRSICFLIPISRGANASFSPLRMPMRSLTVVYQVPQTGQLI